MTKDDKTPRIRITIDLYPEDDHILKDLLGEGKDKKTKMRVVRKALRILAAIKAGEANLTTKQGDRIPLSVIFS